MSEPFAGALRDIACAKINLALHVRARRADGYHELETLFAFVDTGDRLSVAPADGVSLTIDGPFAESLAGGGNLVLDAAHRLREAAGISDGAQIHLDKNLPVAAGLGGGSADAAAALRLLVRLWGVNPTRIDFPLLARSLGADVPACLASTTLLGSGVGERLEPVDVDVSGMPVLLVNPMTPCPTGPVFRGWDGVDRGPLDPSAWREARNDLERPARALVPEIGDVLDALKQCEGANLVRMSGSGATCFALFDDEAGRDAAAQAICALRPEWWTMAGQLK